MQTQPDPPAQSPRKVQLEDLGCDVVSGPVNSNRPVWLEMVIVRSCQWIEFAGRALGAEHELMAVILSLGASRRAHES